MGFTRERPGTDGKVRYAALDRDLKGRQRSAGTFATEQQAERAWQRAEAVIGLGRVAEPRRGRQTFRRYVEDSWLNVLDPPIRGRKLGILLGVRRADGSVIYASWAFAAEGRIALW